MPQPLKSALLLTLRSEQDRTALAQHCTTRIQDLSSSMTSWKEKRKRYADQSKNDFSWRSRKVGDDDKPEDIFVEQNDSLNIVKGLGDYIKARLTDDILGGQDYYAIRGEGKSDKRVAEGMQKHSEWKLRLSDVKDGLEDAIDKAVDLGEGILKVHFKNLERFGERIVNVLIDDKKKPILKADGDYVFDTEEIVTETDEQGKPKKIYPASDPTMDLKGKKLDWKEMVVEDPQTLYRNISARCVHHGDFIASLTAPTLEECDFVGHLYERNLLDLAADYKINPNVLETHVGGDKGPQTEEAKPDEVRGEGTDSNSTEMRIRNPKIKVCECYLDYLIKGRICRVMAVVAVDHSYLLWAEYLGALTPQAMLPFVVVRAWKSSDANRWTGQGMFEALEDDQMFVDRCLNYIGFRNRFNANPVTGVHADNIIGYQIGDKSPIEPGGVIDLKPDKSLKDAVETMVLPDLDSRTWELMQMRMQVMQLRKGVSTAAQGGIDALPQNATATGVDAIMASGNVHSRKCIGEVRKGLEAALLLSLKTLYRHHDPDEAKKYLEGEYPELSDISLASVEEMDFNVALTLTRFRQKEMRENAKVAMDAYAQYLQFPPEERANVRNFVVAVLRSVGYDDAEKMVPVPQIEEKPEAPPAL
jgi:hypothetical protein